MRNNTYFFCCDSTNDSFNMADYRTIVTTVLAPKYVNDASYVVFDNCCFSLRA